MKFKYKKIIFGITLGTMAIGLVTLSVANKKPGSSTNVEKPGIESTANLSSTVPGVTALPDVKTVPLKQDVDPKVNELVTKYFEASVKADTEALSALVSDATSITKEDLQKRYEYIEGMKNIQCYTLDGPVEGSYITYVYYEIKFVDIDTLAPGMVRLYVCTTEDGSLNIFLSDLDDETMEYIEDSQDNPQVAALVTTVNTKLADAFAKDKELKEFNDNLQKSAQNATSTTPKN